MEQVKYFSIRKIIIKKKIIFRIYWKRKVEWKQFCKEDRTKDKKYKRKQGMEGGVYDDFNERTRNSKR